MKKFVVTVLILVTLNIAVLQAMEQKDGSSDQDRTDVDSKERGDHFSEEQFDEICALIRAGKEQSEAEREQRLTEELAEVIIKNKDNPTAAIQEIKKLYQKFLNVYFENNENLAAFSTMLQECLQQIKLSLIEIRDSQKETMLHKACSIGDCEIIKILLGAAITSEEELKNFIFAHNDANQTASDCAQQSGHLHLVGGINAVLKESRTICLEPQHSAP